MPLFPSNDATDFGELHRLNFTSGTLTGDSAVVFPDVQPVWVTKNFMRPKASTTGVKAMSLKDFVANELALVPEVDAVLSARNGKTFYLWAVVNSPDAALRRKVYEREKCIIDEFPDLEFDFSIITRRGRDIAALVNEPGVEITFQRNGWPDEQGT